MRTALMMIGRFAWLVSKAVRAVRRRKGTAAQAIQPEGDMGMRTSTQGLACALPLVVDSRRSFHEV